MKKSRRYSVTKAGDSELERKFQKRYGRRHKDDAELDAFVLQLQSERRQLAQRASDRRMQVLGTVLRHNLDEASRDIDRRDRREEFLASRDPRVARRMYKEWKKEQPFKINTLDRGVEWLPGGVDNPDRSIRFRDRQSAINYTQAQKPSAVVPMGAVDALISRLIADDAAADDREIEDAVREAVKGGSAGLRHRNRRTALRRMR